MAVKTDWQGFIEDGDIVASCIIDRIVAKFDKDTEKKIKRRYYHIFEFNKEESVDNTGMEIPSAKCSFDYANLLEISKLKNKKGYYSQLASRLENSIGFPNLPPAAFSKKLKARPSDEILEMFNRYKRREIFEIKALRAICPEISESQTPATIAGISALGWLTKSPRSVEDIVLALYSFIAKRERDKLFYIRRHPRQRTLQKCHDDGILEHIAVYEWVLGGNPFRKVRKYDHSLSILV